MLPGDRRRTDDGAPAEDGEAEREDDDLDPKVALAMAPFARACPGDRFPYHVLRDEALARANLTRQPRHSRRGIRPKPPMPP